MVEVVKIPKEHHLPSPSKCACCDSKRVRLVDNKELYGTSYGEWPLIYLCTDCGASVSCHRGTNIPMGYMADQETKRARRLAHKAFDPLWRKEKYGNRFHMYRWLAYQMGLTTEKCHISRFNIEQCELATKLCKGLDRFMKSNKKVDIYDYNSGE